jgi:hypothetical protein
MTTCLEEDCEETKILGRKRCTKHYQQWQKANAPECSVDGCTRPVQCKKLCPAHYQQQRLSAIPAEFRLPEGRWAWVPDYEGLYAVSDQGQVHSLPRATTRGLPCSQRRDPGGYFMVTLSKDGRHESVRVHILVLTAFRGPCPDGKEGAHDDGDQANNSLGNLWWKTHRENLLDRARHGTWGSVVHCRWGHPWTKESAYERNGLRKCRICARTAACKQPGCASPAHDHAGTPWKPEPVY